MNKRRTLEIAVAIVLAGGSAALGQDSNGTAPPAPLTAAERLRYAFQGTFSFRLAIMAGAMAGVEQASNKPEQWDQGVSGYAVRFGSIWGQKALYSSLLFGATSLHHEDPRRLYSEKHGFGPRLLDAVKLSWMARRDNGSIGFSYSRLISFPGTRLIAYSWYPDGYASPRKPLQQAGFALAANPLFGILHEFAPDFKKRLLSHPH
jgi:hypothetical protein